MFLKSLKSSKTNIERFPHDKGANDAAFKSWKIDRFYFLTWFALFFFYTFFILLYNVNLFIFHRRFELTTNIASVLECLKEGKKKNATKKTQSTHDQIKNMVDFIEIKYTSLLLDTQTGSYIRCCLLFNAFYNKLWEKCVIGPMSLLYV